MGDTKRTAQGNAGAFLTPDMGGGGGMIAVPMDPLQVGPGKPGPGDEWKIPARPEDEVKGAESRAPEPVQVGHRSGSLYRLTHRG